MSEPADVDWETVGYVKSSDYRTEVLARLVESRLTPSELSDETGIKLPHVSRTLTQLRDEDLVELLVSEERKKGRIYSATAEGERVLDAIVSE